MKRTVAYLLLLSFLVLFTPRDIWHECDHHSDHKELSDELKFDVISSIDVDFCLACDYELGFIDTPTSNSFKVLSTHFNALNQVLFSIYRSNSFDSYSHRGPPMV